MTVKFDLTNHKALWNWLSEHPDKEKSDWSEWIINGGHIAKPCCDCFACEYRNKFLLNNRVIFGFACDACPFIWSDKPCGLYQQYVAAHLAKNLVLTSQLAEQIRDLPVKDWVEIK